MFQTIDVTVLTKNKQNAQYMLPERGGTVVFLTFQPNSLVVYNVVF